MREYVVIDLETTGFSPTGDCIIEVGAVKVQDGVVVGRFSTLVCPTKYIPEKVIEITGITNEMVFDAPLWETVAENLYMFVGNLPIVGHNIPFDYKFLVHHFDRVGLDFTLGGTRVGVCTLAASRVMLRSESYKLGVLADQYIDMSDYVGDAHRALYDAEMTHRLYQYLLSVNFKHPQLYSYSKIRSLEVAVRRVC